MKIRVLSVLLVPLLLLEGVAFACYQWSQPPVPCLQQGGNNCAGIGAWPVLACPGGPWTAADMAERGLNPADPCDWRSVEHLTPKNFAVTGQLPTGDLVQGRFSYTCTSDRICRKAVIGLPFPLVLTCTAPPLTTCTTIWLNTCGGGACPAPGTGGGD